MQRYCQTAAVQASDLTIFLLIVVNWQSLKKYKSWIGLFLLADGFLSVIFQINDAWFLQVGRVVHAGIGLLILAV